MAFTHGLLQRLLHSMQPILPSLSNLRVSFLFIHFDYMFRCRLKIEVFCHWHGIAFTGAEVALGLLVSFFLLFEKKQPKE